MNNSRRHFIKKASMGTAAVSLGAILPGFSARSYRNIIGANDKIMVASMGVNSRGLAVASNFAAQKNAEVMYVCDVDSRAADKCIAAVEKIQNKRPAASPDRARRSRRHRHRAAARCSSNAPGPSCRSR